MVELIWFGRKLIGLRSRGDPLIDQVLFNQILQQALLVARNYLRDCATSSDFLSRLRLACGKHSDGQAARYLQQEWSSLRRRSQFCPDFSIRREGRGGGSYEY
jgi:hypothetical protein